MTTVAETVGNWVEEAQQKLSAGTFSAADLTDLLIAVCQKKQVRQRLLYLHAATPNIQSSVVGMALHEPVPGWVSQIDATQTEWPYHSVRDAVVDGWHIIHFPDQRAPFEDNEIDVMGYEFILQKLEEYDDNTRSGGAASGTGPSTQ
jgi:hypothetical protein